jgi:hypothetical protein
VVEFFPTIGSAFSKARAVSLYKAGLCHIKDVWDNGALLPSREVRRVFGLRNQELQSWDTLIQAMTRYWGAILINVDQWSSLGEWVGVFQNPDSSPDFVFQSPGGRNWQVETQSQDFYLSLDYTVLNSTCYLVKVSEDLCLSQAVINLRELESRITGTLRVAPITRGPKKVITNLYYGQMDQLEWDPNRFTWTGNVPFMIYTTKLGRQWLTNRHVLPDVVDRKWRGILPQGFRLRWSTVWDNQRVRKEAGLLWRMWHRAVKVNSWRGAINVNIVQSCPVCWIGARETVLHCFWECKAAKEAWNWGMTIIQTLADGPQRQRHWTPINWKQSIFSYRVPRRFRVVGRFWALLRSTVLWTIWIWHNDMAHNGIQWHLAKVKQRFWRCMIDYG